MLNFTLIFFAEVTPVPLHTFQRSFETFEMDQDKPSTHDATVPRRKGGRLDLVKAEESV